LKLVTPNFFSAKSDHESYFTVDDNERQQKSYYESDDHPATEDVQFIRKTKFPAKVLLWLVVSESGISEPVFSKPVLQSPKKSTYQNVYQYFINLSKNTTQIIFWPDLASAHYAKDTCWSD
jgi:hypothetical protein